MTDTDLTTTRRGILTAALALPATALAASVPTTAQAAPTDRTAWDRAFAAFELATFEDEAFGRVYNDVEARYFAALAAIPHTALRPDPYSGRFIPVTTADEQFVKRARRLVEDVRAGRCYLETERYPDLGEHYRLCRETKVAADKRDRKVRQLNARLGMDEVEAMSEALGQRAYEAKWALMELPAPDGAALLWKLGVLLDADSIAWEEKAVSPAMADARRLLTREA